MLRDASIYLDSYRTKAKDNKIKISARTNYNVTATNAQCFN